MSTTISLTQTNMVIDTKIVVLGKGRTHNVAEITFSVAILEAILVTLATILHVCMHTNASMS
jgi:hypothetical protein